MIAAALDQAEFSLDVLAQSSPKRLLVLFNRRHELHIQIAEVVDVTGEVGVRPDAVRRILACAFFDLVRDMNVDRALIGPGDGNGHRATGCRGGSASMHGGILDHLPGFRKLPRVNACRLFSDLRRDLQFSLLLLHVFDVLQQLNRELQRVLIGLGVVRGAE